MQQVQLTAALSGNGPSPDTCLPQEGEVHLNFRGTNNTPYFLFEEHVKGASGIHNGARACVCSCVRVCADECCVII